MKKTITAAALTAVLLLGPAAITQAETNTSDTYRQLNLFGDVFERVRSEYVEQVTDEQLIEAAINGMLTSLDPHSSYLNKKSFQDMQVQTRGEFGGLGIEVTLENGLIKVVSPIDDTPAARAGLQPGDLIVQINGEAVMGMALSDAVERMRGPVGSTIKLTIRRGETTEPFDVSLTRDVVRIQSVRYRPEGDVGYIRITTFNEQTQSGIEKAIDSLSQEIGEDKLIGYVIDLRNNPGGLLDQAVSVSDSFLEKGEIVSTRSRNAEDGQRYNAGAGDLAKGKPVVVLINGGSASASEIVAGALQDHRRAIVLGTQSFGKGSVQTIIPLSGQGAMRLTTARYYTPAGRSIQQLGITPDIEVQPARIEEIAQAQRRREADLRGALTNDTNRPPGQPQAQPEEEGAATPVPGPGAAAPPAGAAPAEPGQVAEDGVPGEDEVDYQLARAMDLLRGVSLFNNRAVN
jgi:carboxyl-terminal processing protease